MEQEFNFEKELVVVTDLQLEDSGDIPVVLFKAVEVGQDEFHDRVIYHILEQSPHARSTFKYVKKGLRVRVLGDHSIITLNVNGNEFQRNCVHANKVKFLEFPKEMREQKARSLFQMHAEKLV